MKKALLVLVAICLLLPMTAHARPPEGVQGDFFYFPTGCQEERSANGNQFLLDCGDDGQWYQGNFVGESNEEYEVALLGYQGTDGDTGLPIYDYGLYKGTVTFTGTVTVDTVSRSGTLTIKMVGTSPGDIADWNGTWRIIGGTGELANLHGNGVFWNNGLLHVHYEGQVHFDPQGR